MKFTKMHGIGNDYIYINCFEEKIDDPVEFSKKYSDRHFGIGGDGIVMICPSEIADFKMRMFNADGSEGKMCGNATRCIGKYVFDNGLTDKTEITLETISGIKYLNLNVKDGKVSSVCVDMGEPILKPSDIPTNFEGENVIDREITVDGKDYRVTCVSMGNPHAVVYVDDVDSLDLETIGPGFENHELFPERINTEFVKVIDRNTLKMRVWERGSGETWACGTGACAVLAATVLNGLCDKKAKVMLRGGELEIKWGDNGSILMTGPAETVFTGEV